MADTPPQSPESNARTRKNKAKEKRQRARMRAQIAAADELVAVLDQMAEVGIGMPGEVTAAIEKYRRPAAVELVGQPPLAVSRRTQMRVAVVLLVAGVVLIVAAFPFADWLAIAGLALFLASCVVVPPEDYRL